MNSDRHVKIFDTTLRDGQQCPGAGMSFDKNLQYARLACDLNIDILEAGFPAASALDFEIVHTIAKEYSLRAQSPIVAALCQLRREQVERTVESLRPVIALGRARLHTYVPVDPALMAASLGGRAEQKDEIIKDVFDLIKLAVDSGCEVQFSPEGYSRMGSNFDFVTDVIRAAVSAGATVINCPDTIGGACVYEGEQYFVRNMSRHAAIIAGEFPQADITWSVHCHNDFGLAVQNTINAVFDGPARQIEGCINGIGERAGNASLEQCIMIVSHFGQSGDSATGSQSGENGHGATGAGSGSGEIAENEGNRFYTTVNTPMLQPISDFVSKNMLPRQPHWPVCGDNATKHSSGGHTNAILKNPLAYQPFDPKEIGKQVTFVFGPLSGGNHAKSIIEAHGFICGDSEKARIAQFVKERFSQRRKGITDDEFMQAHFEFRQPMLMEQIDYEKHGNVSKVEVVGSFEGKPIAITQQREGNDSAIAALKMALEQYFGPFEILNHRSQSETAGTSAKSISYIEIEDQKNNKYTGVGSDQDIEISALRALVDAVNHWYVTKHFAIAQSTHLIASPKMGPKLDKSVA
jgi:2-isopropylmalate synthase